MSGSGFCPETVAELPYLHSSILSRELSKLSWSKLSWSKFPGAGFTSDFCVCFQGISVSSSLSLSSDVFIVAKWMANCLGFRMTLSFVAIAF